MSVNPAVIYNNGSILVDELSTNGTLIDIINSLKAQNKPFPKSIAAYFSLELLLIMQQIHKCHIIHADVKPDNVLVLNL